MIKGILTICIESRRIGRYSEHCCKSTHSTIVWELHISNNCTPIVLVVCIYHKKKIYPGHVGKYTEETVHIGRNYIINGGDTRNKWEFQYLFRYIM